MVRSSKNQVFEYLFKERYNPETGKLSNSIVTLSDVSEAIRQLTLRGQVSLSANNPANFIKDYLRSSQRNANWPTDIREAGYTAEQRTGEGLCFEFVPLAPGEEPFPDPYAPTGDEPEFIVQTLSLPLSTREIVRADEQSVAQIAVKLHLVESLFASSEVAMSWGLEQVTHLQNNVKLRESEIDALFQATLKPTDPGEMPRHGAITVEVKIGDPIIPTQLEKQARAALENDAFSFCVPAYLLRNSRGELVAAHLGLFWKGDLRGGEALDLGDAVHGMRFKFRPELPAI